MFVQVIAALRLEDIADQISCVIESCELLYGSLYAKLSRSATGAARPSRYLTYLRACLLDRVQLTFEQLVITHPLVARTTLTMGLLLRLTHRATALTHALA